MREFSWRYFTLTGNIEAYLLYRRQAEVQPHAVHNEEEDTEVVQALIDSTQI
ncbi:YqzL family protein [Alicyclobacillus sp. SO9]|uniref:YqzL family protein n=1 Tax=Alicyclobacillus sp. SO9 TaxID=2665646 RepID=UPI0018E7BA3E|nr:YqzL family protein [Alicyclobacillus sp. SO9]QQE77330.1 YqzL family protein [Alicyclobacillus sp. SO9]